MWGSVAPRNPDALLSLCLCGRQREPRLHPPQLPDTAGVGPAAPGHPSVLRQVCAARTALLRGVFVSVG